VVANHEQQQRLVLPALPSCLANILLADAFLLTRIVRVLGTLEELEIQLEDGLQDAQVGSVVAADVYGTIGSREGECTGHSHRYSHRRTGKWCSTGAGAGTCIDTGTGTLTSITAVTNTDRARDVRSSREYREPTCL
jgi:hypothetical protein